MLLKNAGQSVTSLCMIHILVMELPLSCVKHRKQSKLFKCGPVLRKQALPAKSVEEGLRSVSCTGAVESA